MLSTPGVSSLLSLQIWICKKGLMVSSVVLICTCEVCQTVSSGHGEQRKACLPLETALRGCQRACLAEIITCKCRMVLKWAVQELLEKGMPVLLWIVFLLFLSPVCSCFHVSGLSLWCAFGWVYLVVLMKVLWIHLDEKFVTVCFARLCAVI